MGDVYSDDKEDRRRVLVQNERVKLRANALDRLSTASVAAGFIGPFASMSSGGFASAISPSIIASTAVWLVAAFVLHMGAQFMLGRLEP